MTFYLLKDINNGEPYEMLCFKNSVNRDEIQDCINNANNEYYEFEQNISKYYDSAYAYVMSVLYKKYNVSVIEWDNSNNLYF